MKICVFGAGAIGGYLAVELALAGHEVSAVARGEHLAAMRARGLTLRIGGREKTARVRATDDPGELGPQDYVFCALKAHQAHEVANRFAPLLGPETAVVTAMNGIPWWYFYKEGGALEGQLPRFGRPGWAPVAADRAGARHRLRGRSCVRGGGTGRHRAPRVQPVHAGRARPDRLAAGDEIEPSHVGGGLRCAGARQHPLERVAEAVGQRLLQSDQRAHPCHAGPDHDRACVAPAVQRPRCSRPRRSARRWASISTSA